MPELDISNEKAVHNLAVTNRVERSNERKKGGRLIYLAIAGAAIIVVLIVIWAAKGRPSIVLKPATNADTKKQAVSLFNKGNFQKAIPKLKVYVDEHPSDAGARTVLAQSYWLNGKNKQALDQYLEIIKIKPDDADTLYRLGILYGLLKQNDKSIGSLEKAVKVNPRLAVFQAELAKAYARTGKYDQAVNHWQKALELTPESNATYRAGVLAEIGNDYVLKGDNAKAREAYTQGLTIEPGNAYLKSQLQKLGGK